MKKFDGMLVGGTMAGGWLEEDEPVMSIFKRTLLPPFDTRDEPLAAIKKETYIWVSGIHGNNVSNRWNGFWVIEDKVKFINGKYDDKGWAFNEVAKFYFKYAATKAPNF